jgi:hypothetical protein
MKMYLFLFGAHAFVSMGFHKLALFYINAAPRIFAPFSFRLGNKYAVSSFHLLLCSSVTKIKTGVGTRGVLTQLLIHSEGIMTFCFWFGMVNLLPLALVGALLSLSEETSDWLLNLIDPDHTLPEDTIWDYLYLFAESAIGFAYLYGSYLAYKVPHGPVGIDIFLTPTILPSEKF